MLDSVYTYGSIQGTFLNFWTLDKLEYQETRKIVTPPTDPTALVAYLFPQQGQDVKDQHLEQARTNLFKENGGALYPRLEPSDDSSITSPVNRDKTASSPTVYQPRPSTWAPIPQGQEPRSDEVSVSTKEKHTTLTKEFAADEARLALREKESELQRLENMGNVPREENKEGDVAEERPLMECY